jgi:hypothetical protein
MQPWKAKILPLLFHGPKDEFGFDPPSAERTVEMKQIARSMKVQLLPTEHGSKLVET